MATARQSWQYTDTGILRKKEEDEELLVFGYSCKLFRDDEKALFIDQGKHLIPWMGDETLKIDRYDGRGALYDLKQYEPLPGGHDENRWVGLSETERRFEQLCDEERYRSLHHNEEEEALYQEEELKRLHKALGANDYGQVGFTYEEPAGGKGDEKAGAEVADEEEEEGGDEPFVAPPELDIPINMVLPETVKLNAIIMKTAMFINQQGPQMEILLKMKQANNPQFQFLSFDSQLHPYYRHLLMAIKSGRYRPPGANKPKEESHEEGGDDHYLHPSLAPTGSRLELAPSIPSINYKPSADCAYSMLVNRIKDKQVAFGLRPPDPPEPPPPAYYPVAIPEPSPVIEAAPVRYEHKPVEEPQPVLEVVKPPVVHVKPKSKGKAAKAAAAAAAAAMVPVAMPITVPPAPIVQPTLVEPLYDEPTMKDDVGYSDTSGSSSSSSSRSSSPVVPPPTMVTPSSDMQIIIDKMASYVAKNGQDFEAIVRSKGDARFAFLEENHQFNAYYRHKIAVYKKLEAKEKKVAEVKHEQDTCGEESQDAIHHSPDSQGSDDAEDGKDDNGRSRSKPAPVCFSIKKPKEAECLLLEKRSALPVEESSDEEEGQEGGEKSEEKKKVVATPAAAAVPEKVPEVQTQERHTEVIDLTEELSHSAEEEKKAKWAEERVKDKLAAAAREKLAAFAKEKQLQLERKRRAAAFLNMIQKDHPMQAPAPPIIGPLLPDGGPVVRVSADDDDDVSSIPSLDSSDIHSPPHLGSRDPADRLSPKQQNGDANHSSLYARIQASTQSVKKREHRSSSSESSKNGTSRHRHKHKRKKSSSSHRRGRSLSPGHHSRAHRLLKRDHVHSASKKMKKQSSRSRSRSHSKMLHSRSSHSHSRSVHDTHRDRHKKKKKSSKHSDSP